MKKLKINTDLLISIFVIILFFGTFNAYAAEEGKIDIPKAHESTIETFNTASGVEDPNEYNSMRSQAVTATSLVSSGIVILAPELTIGGEDVKGSSTITQDMKRGILGLAEDGVYAMYESQPSANVYAHLAKEWLPGYQDSTSVYAEINTGPYDSGYTELLNSGVVDLWAQIRNVTYVFFILIFIIVGFMIMFRSKIGGQTLVTLGNTLPNIIVALIGVTFSFAIAGIIIDIGGVIMVILADIIETVGGFEDVVTLESFGSIFKAFGGIFNFSKVEGKGLFSILGGGISGGLAGLGIAAGMTGFMAVLGGLGIVGLAIVLAILGVVTVGVIKVLITLIKAYLGILVGVVTGPLQIAISAIPGKSKGFVNWMLSIARNVLVYPITFAILNFPGILYSANDKGGVSLPGPDKLTLPQSQRAIDQSTDLVSGFMIFILQIIVIFAASNADKYAQAILPPTTSKEGATAAAAMKKGMQGIPLVGKLIK
jgi:hypothetical protein